MNRFCVLLAALAVAALVVADKETFNKVDQPRLVFSPKPEGLTNTPTVKLPRIEIPTTLLSKLGGADITNLAVSAVANLLNNSGRFVLTYGSSPQYACRVMLNDLRVRQIGKNSTSDGSKLLGWLPIKVNLNGKPTNIDWNSDETTMNVRCAVSVHVIQQPGGTVVGSDKGEVDRTDSTKKIKLDLLGLTSSKAETITNTVSFEGRLIELASYYAISNMLPQLDKRLAGLGTQADSVDGRAEKKPDMSISADTPGNKPGVEARSVAERLRQLKDLFDQGLVSKDEYEKKRKEIVDSL